MDFAQWLFSVFLAGLAINLIAMYLKPRIDVFLIKYSDKRRARNEKREREFQATAKRFANSPLGRLEIGQRLQYSVNDRAYGLLLLILAMVLIALGMMASELAIGLILMITGAVTGFLGTVTSFGAMGGVRHYRSLQRTVWELTGGADYELEDRPEPPLAQ